MVSPSPCSPAAPATSSLDWCQPAWTEGSGLLDGEPSVGESVSCEQSETAWRDRSPWLIHAAPHPKPFGRRNEVGPVVDVNTGVGWPSSGRDHSLEELNGRLLEAHLKRHHRRIEEGDGTRHDAPDAIEVQLVRVAREDEGLDDGFERRQLGDEGMVR